MRPTLGMGGDQAGMSPALTAAPVLSTALHSEPYIMFSTDKKSLLCIRCFRDMQGWVGRGSRQGVGAAWMERVSLDASPQGEPGPLCGPGVSLRARMRAAGAGSAGESGTGRAGGRGGGGSCENRAETLLSVPRR